MIDTVPLRVLLTNTRRSLRVRTRKRGSSPTLISFTFALSCLFTRMTETESLSGFTTQTNLSSLVMAIGLELVCASSTCLALSEVDNEPSAAKNKHRRQQGTSESI